MPDTKRCFVVMGFGTKTDLATGRKLNLDKSYNALIKPVVESKGLVCVRADEIRHSGSIDVPMYQELLTADVVIADISTANANALYELGIRHALRQRTTIIISEEQLNYPFDLNHILINKYTHLGDSIDYFEVLRFQKLLGDTLETVLKTEDPDSPIYTFLDDLIPPKLQRQAEKVAQQVNDALKAGDVKDKSSADSQTMSFIVKQGEDALEAKQYSLAKSFFNTALLMLNSNTGSNVFSNDSYLVHRLAYATYKAKEPDVVSALKESIRVLSQLDLGHTNDSETVILAGRIEKKLYFSSQGEDHLASAVLYFERGNFLLNNRFNCINLAFLLNCRVESSLFNTVEDKIADTVVASRTRRRVLAKCEQEWSKLTTEATDEEKKILTEGDELAAKQKALEEEQKFWIQVNKAEAYFGLGEMENYKKALALAQSIEHTDAMMKAFTEQLETLRLLLRKHGHLLNPAWKEA